MSNRVKHIFIFIFIFSVFSLTLQTSVTSLSKNAKAIKTQNQTNPISEEEEEQHDSDEEADEALFVNNDMTFANAHYLSDTFWCNPEHNYFSFTKSIPIPPPKF